MARVKNWLPIPKGALNSKIGGLTGKAVLTEAPAPPKRPAAVRQDIEPFPSIRLAEPFEALRDASDRVQTATGARPKVFLANLGTPSDFTARTTFAKNFFEAGGIEAITNNGFVNLDDLVEAFKMSGARLVCLCSSNDIYARQAAVTATELSKSPAGYVYLAGRPGELEVVLKAAGVRSLIYAGCDVLAVLQGGTRLSRHRVRISSLSGAHGRPHSASASLRKDHACSA